MESYAFFKNEFVPLSEAKVSIMTHALNYGTGCFEGIRGNWNEEEQQVYLFRVREHFERLHRSCRILKLDLPYTVDRLCEIAAELVRRTGYQEDCYVRPIAYKGGEVIGVRLHNVRDDFSAFTAPLGSYLSVDEGARCATSSWRRIDDNGAPVRGKLTGLYVNGALAKTEANENGFDEAIMLTHEGHVSEGSGENIFIVLDGKLHTPAPSENILIGITRQSVIQIAREKFGLETIERQIDRSELYVCDECFMTGTAAHVTPVIEIDRRPVGDGKAGSVTSKLMKMYFDTIRGKVPEYRNWCYPVYSQRAPALKPERVASGD